MNINGSKVVSFDSVTGHLTCEDGEQWHLQPGTPVTFDGEVKEKQTKENG